MLPARNVTEPLKLLYVQKQRMHDERPMYITTLMIKCVMANKTDSIKTGSSANNKLQYFIKNGICIKNFTSKRSSNLRSINPNKRSKTKPI